MNVLKLNLGIGAKGTVFTQFVRSTFLIKAKYATFDGEHIYAALLVGEEVRTIIKNSEHCYTLRHDGFEKQLYTLRNEM